MKRILLALLVLLAALAGVVLVRATRLPSLQLPAETAVTVEPLPGAAERLAAALRIPTVSHGDTARSDAAAFAALHAHLAGAFPRVHATLRREEVVRGAVLYTWPGSDPALAPVVLMGHLDVVPVEPGTDSAWTRPPFGGEIADGFVWGRGALDDKAGVLGILEAVEALLAGGFTPRRTVHLAFGGDEEVGGAGARGIAALLRARGIRPELVLDEGGVVTEGIVPGVAGRVALIGIAEKGYLDVEITARDRGGHSSMPPRVTAVGRVSRAVTALEDHPLRAELGGTTGRFLDYLGPEMPFGMRVVMANRWLFGPAVRWQMSASPSTDAGIRTTTAPTMLQGSEKANVLASRARAVVNFRLRPGERIADVMEHVRRVVDDPALELRPVGPQAEPSPISSTDSEAWRALNRSIRQVYPEAVVAPYLVVGATDARHFAGLSRNVYRFLPVVMRSEDLGRMHGTDERIAVDGYRRAVRFYAQLLRNTAA